MRYRLFGRTGLRVSELFLGAMTLSDAAETRRIVAAYAEAGGNVLDTASAYGDSERLLGEALAGRGRFPSTERDRFVLASKYTLSRDQQDPNAAGNHRKNLIGSLEQSLRRLRTDYLDVLWVHTWDRHTPIEETLRALDDLVRAGKIRYIGVSDTPAWVISRADLLAEWRGWTAFAGIQVPYSLVNRDIERDIVPLAEHLGLSIAAWGVLDHGGLTGSSRVAEPTERQRRVVAALREVAGELGASPGQVAIAWTMARSAVVHPIVGFRHADRVPDSLAAVELRLPAETVITLEAAAPFEPGPYADFLTESAASPFVFGNSTILGR
ncbi:aryl-alcohol dehydrogenase-like predicted oxidoreductase [Tamaricihabitans halophyticus]|uniref:Aryl-alcohol dehydrogenase-like predicted oxidoreductase n=1 Tax=Tamaricihabitans halophyticus TaxID=1262583 RepID=A0A4R2QH72_9PSEU|nr:aldo/keto reductase [Tamaricihabitans halophyticus]TCP48487.1 aryl-alcohol dehydrogenase-like predicted oxidoreductase [Tamaricihabitans halophyticus]